MGAAGYMLAGLALLLIVGALAGRRTLLHSFALAFDMFVQGLAWNRPIGVTISSRAGLSAREGRPFFAKLIGVLFFDPDHCEKSIAADIQRALDALSTLGHT